MYRPRSGYGIKTIETRLVNTDCQCLGSARIGIRKKKASKEYFRINEIKHVIGWPTANPPVGEIKILLNKN